MDIRHFLMLGAVWAGACSNNNSPSDMAVSPDMTSPPPDLLAPPDLGPALSVRAQKGLTMLSPVSIDTSTLTLAQKELVGTGAYLVVNFNCARCHNTTGGSTFLAGGDNKGSPANPVYARNLTPDATTGMTLTQDQFIEAMRTGKDFVDNGAMQVMPLSPYRWLSLYDLQAIYAYLKAIPAANNKTMADMKTAPGTPTPLPAMYSDGDVPRAIPADSVSDPLGVQRGMALQPLADPTNFSSLSTADQAGFGRGSYLVTMLGCNGCHTNPATTAGKINTPMFLSGGRVFATAAAMQAALRTVRVMSTNLTGMTHGFAMTSDQFVQSLTNHTHADEPAMRPLGSPMPDYKDLVPDDMRDLYLYLKNVPRRTDANDKATQDSARYCTKDADCDAAAGETCYMTTFECIGKTCAANADCDACQTCSGSKKCDAPAAASTCLSGGI